MAVIVDGQSFPTFADLPPLTCRDVLVAARSASTATEFLCEWNLAAGRLARLGDPYHAPAWFVMGKSEEDPEILRVCAVCVMKIPDRRILGRVKPCRRRS